MDPRKLERVFFNLLLNACEASVGVCEQIEIYADAGESSVAIRVKDAGRGIPYEVRASLFNPFVSSGKVSGPVWDWPSSTRLLVTTAGKYVSKARLEPAP